MLLQQLHDKPKSPEPRIFEQIKMDEDVIEKAIKPYIEEKEKLCSRNAELEQKLQSLLGEYAIMKSDCEIVKTKARSLLIEKD